MSIGDALFAQHDETLDQGRISLAGDEKPSSCSIHNDAHSDRSCRGRICIRCQTRTVRLESLLHHLDGSFDRCVIDCPPNIGLLTYNALRAATEAIVPVETGYFSLRGARRQRKDNRSTHCSNRKAN